MSDIEANVQAAKVLWCDFFGGWQPSDAQLLEPYRFTTPLVPNQGEIIDWLGIRTDIACHGWVTVPPVGYIHILGLPIPTDMIHAEAIEYVALAVAMERAVANFDGNFRAIELGASYAPWAIAAAVLAERKGFGDIEVRAVEASEATVPKILAHASRNGLTDKPHIRVKPIFSAVHVSDEDLFFPRVNVASDNGARATTEMNDTDYRGLALAYDRVPGLRLSTLCADLTRVDFLHLDLQGAEEDLLQDDDFMATLDTKVATLFLATQSRLIEGIALKKLAKLGWRLIRERPTTYQQNDRTADVNGWTTRDGGQLWLNPRFGNTHI